MTTPVITTPPATVPQRGSATFSAEGDAWVTYENTIYSTDLPAAITWIAGQVSSAEALYGTPNYQGIYSAGTTYAIGESVLYSSEVYVANTVNLGVTPVDGANWRKIAPGKAISFQDAVVTLSGTTPDVDLSLGGVYRLTTSGNTTFTRSNDPDEGYTTIKTLRITAGGTHTLTFWAGIETVDGAAIVAPASGETREYTLRASTVSAVTTYVLIENGTMS